MTALEGVGVVRSFGIGWPRITAIRGMVGSSSSISEDGDEVELSESDSYSPFSSGSVTLLCRGVVVALVLHSRFFGEADGISEYL